MSKNRSMVKLLHADGFYPQQDVKNLKNAVSSMTFVPSQYGDEVERFNLIPQDAEFIFQRVVGERLQIDYDRSGIIRRPYNNAIHFEDFQNPNEWCFILALEPTTVNLWHHIEDQTMGELSAADSTSAIEGFDYNYRNLFEWKIHTNILLEENQGLFIRPWMFHSLENGLVQYYRLLADERIRILVMGLPDSSRSKIAHELDERIQNSELIHSMSVRQKKKDLDFTIDGNVRHTHRILTMAQSSESNAVILDMTCPREENRRKLNCDFTIWVNDASESTRYPDLNEMFEPPSTYDMRVTKYKGKDTIDDVLERILTKPQ